MVKYAVKKLILDIDKYSTFVMYRLKWEKYLCDKVHMSAWQFSLQYFNELNYFKGLNHLFSKYHRGFSPLHVYINQLNKHENL